jgi:tRNA(fMet)-specific endonuclease VapC
MYMLDTDTVSFVIRGTSAQLDRRIRATRPRDLCISAITRGELLYGVALKPDSHRLAQVVDQFLCAIASRPWDDAAAACYGRTAATLQRLGQSIGAMDALIAAHALATQSVLVTHNTRHFGRIPGLRLEDWCATR